MPDSDASRIQRHAAGILALNCITKVNGKQMQPVKIRILRDQRSKRLFLLGRPILRAFADEDGRVFRSKPTCRLGTSVLNLFAPGAYMVGHHLSTSSVAVQTNLVKKLVGVVTSLLPTLPQILFELADMTVSADNRLALRKLSGPEPSPDGFD